MTQIQNKTKYRIYFLTTILLGMFNDVYLKEYSDWIFSRNFFSLLFALLLGGRIVMSREVLLRGLFGFFASHFFAKSLKVLSVQQITVYYYFLPVLDIIISPSTKRMVPIFCLLVLVFFLETWNLDILIACIFWSFSDFLIRSYKKSIIDNIVTFHFINLLLSCNEPLNWRIWPVGFSDFSVQFLLFLTFRHMSFESLFPLRLVDIFIAQRYSNLE